MRIAATFTPLFLNTSFIKTEESNAAVLREREKGYVYYSREKYETVANFIRSDDFGRFRQEYKALLDCIDAFVKVESDQLTTALMDSTKEMVQKRVATLKRNLFEENFFNSGREDHRPQMYGKGKTLFHEFISLMQDKGIPLQRRMNAALNVADRLDKCSGGILNELPMDIAVLKTAGLKGVAYKWKKQMMEALILEHVKDNHPYSTGNETHYVAAYYNKLAQIMGLEKTTDPYADKLLEINEITGVPTITQEDVDACQSWVIQKLQLKPTRLAAHIADEYRGQIEEFLRKENITPDRMDPKKDLEKLDTAMKDLTPEYGEVSWHDLVEMTEDGMAMAYVGAKQPARGTRHFLRELKKQRLVEYESKKSRIVLSETDEGRVKILNDLLWLKEGKGKYGTIREFPASALLQLAPGELLDKIEQAGTNRQERTLLLQGMVGHIHESLEAAGSAGEALEPWLKGFAAKMNAMAARQASGDEPSWEPGWSGPVILLAAAFDQEPALRELLEAGGDANARNGNGRTALMLAAQGDHGQVAQVLIGQGADISAKDKNGKTALMIAAANGNIKVLEAVLESEPQMQDKDASLHIAAAKGRGAVVSVLLHHGADKDIPNNGGVTPLIVAVKKGHVGVMKALIEAQASLEAEDKNKRTPLMLAVQAGHVEAVKALIEAKANLEAKDKDGSTPLMIAAEKGHVEVVKALIGAKANLEGRDKDGLTLLMLAAKRGHVDVMKALIEAKANLEDRDKDKRTPLMLAAQAGHVEAVKALIGANANLEVTGSTKWPPLIAAAERGHVEVVKAMIEAKVNLEIKGFGGWTPLIAAAMRGRVEVVKALIEAKANLEARTNEDEWTPLIAAAYNGHAEAVKVLVQQYDNGVHDFMVAARNNSQWFGDKAKRTLIEVLQKLAQEGSTPVLQKLINAEAGKIKDAQGNTALMAAVRNGHVEAAKVLVQQYDNGVHELMAAARENSESGRNAKETLLRVLQELAQEGSTAILQKLIKAGAGKMKDARGKTALMRSVEMMESDGERGLQALKALLDAGADISIQDADNQTVMHHATVLANREHDANSAAYTAAVAALAQAADKKKKFADIWSLWR